MTRRPRIEDLTAFAVPEQPALSPDGSQIAYVLRSTDRAAVGPVVEPVGDRADGRGLFRSIRRHLHVRTALSSSPPGNPGCNAFLGLSTSVVGPSAWAEPGCCPATGSALGGP